MTMLYANTGRLAVKKGGVGQTITPHISAQMDLFSVHPLAVHNGMGMIAYITAVILAVTCHAIAVIKSLWWVVG